MGVRLAGADPWCWHAVQARARITTDIGRAPGLCTAQSQPRCPVPHNLPCTQRHHYKTAIFITARCFSRGTRASPAGGQYGSIKVAGNDSTAFILDFYNDIHVEVDATTGLEIRTSSWLPADDDVCCNNNTDSSCAGKYAKWKQGHALGPHLSFLGDADDCLANGKSCLNECFNGDGAAPTLTSFGRLRVRPDPSHSELIPRQHPSGWFGGFPQLTPCTT